MEGLDQNCSEPSIVTLVNKAGFSGLRCEIYTRLEQIFDRARLVDFSLRRLRQLHEMKPSLARVFVGLESGSDSQLRRYGKGQTTQGAVDALRAGSLLGLPLEFGFITFDPLLTQHELIENIIFLARTDVLIKAVRAEDQAIDRIYSLVSETEGCSTSLVGDAVFTRIAYMATELELFVNSPFLKLLASRHPELIGEYDASFARYNYRYQDPVIGHIASWCRVWTEGTFAPIYRMRLAARTAVMKVPSCQAMIRRYREATFGLLLVLAGRSAEALKGRVRCLSGELMHGLPIAWEGELDSESQIAELGALWTWVVGDQSGLAPLAFKPGIFTLESLERRRDT